ncbi:MAG: response regulator [Streptococcaceae bacterium]|jgi:signal transduction histidine kinase|nr:response regulator [Streptococcaceae bacterium]
MEIKILVVDDDEVIRKGVRIYLEQDGYQVEEAENGEVALEKLSQQTLKQTSLKSEAFKNDLISNVSHDLRTPLTAIVTYGDLLTQRELTEETRQEYVSVINQKIGTYEAND